MDLFILKKLLQDILMDADNEQRMVRRFNTYGEGTLDEVSIVFEHQLHLGIAQRT